MAVVARATILVRRDSVTSQPDRRARVVPIVIGLPLAAALAVTVAMSAGGALRGRGFAPNYPRNLAEALALLDAATAVRLLRGGADANAIYDIRPGMLNSELGLQVRPLAAAAYTLDDVIVQLALQYGARLPPDDARSVACWVARSGRETVVRLVAPPGWTEEACGLAGELR